MTLPLILVLFAVALLCLAPFIGVMLFSPARARSLKHVEAHEAQMAVEVAYLRVRHPELLAGHRYDRHDAYIWAQLALLAYGFVVVFVTVPYASYGSGLLGTKYTLGFSLIIGAVLSLIGSAMGLKVGPWVVAPRVRHNVTSAVLGDDVSLPYVLAVCGAFSSGISMAFYGYTVIMAAGLGRMFTTLGGVLAIAIGGMCFTLIPKFVVRGRKYISDRALLIDEALARIERQ